MGYVNVAHGVRAVGYVEPRPAPGRTGRAGHALRVGVLRGAARAARARVHGRGVLRPGAGHRRPPAYVDYALGLPRDRRDRARPRDDAGRRPRCAASLRRGGRRATSRWSCCRSAPASGDARWSRRTQVRWRGAPQPGRRSPTPTACTWSATSASCSTRLELFAARTSGAPALGRSSGLAAVLDSGAERALLVDVATAAGVHLRGDLRGDRPTGSRRRLDPGLIATNPLDVWGNGADTGGPVRRRALRARGGSRGAGGRAGGRPRRGARRRRVLPAGGARRAAQQTDLPVVVLSHLPSALDLAAQPRSALARAYRYSRAPGAGCARSVICCAMPLPSPQPPPTRVDHARQARWRGRLATGLSTVAEGIRAARRLRHRGGCRACRPTTRARCSRRRRRDRLSGRAEDRRGHRAQDRRRWRGGRARRRRGAGARRTTTWPSGLGRASSCAARCHPASRYWSVRSATRASACCSWSAPAACWSSCVADRAAALPPVGEEHAARAARRHAGRAARCSSRAAASPPTSTAVA